MRLAQSDPASTLSLTPLAPTSCTLQAIMSVAAPPCCLSRRRRVPCQSFWPSLLCSVHATAACRKFLGWLQLPHGAVQSNNSAPLR